MTDNTPDFDSMSPEELMAWMESLAKRQGAEEGFTTAADMQIAEVDPSTVSVDEPGYIPYGMDTEQWEVKRAEEERRKAERRAAQQQAAPTPPASAPVTPPPAPVAAPPPVAESAPAADLDPENMTPEQLMAWMESLAKRQGASEGFTTAADMQIAEVDPTTAAVDEPGYIPYGMDAEQWAKKQAEEAARKAERQQQQTAAPTPPPAPVTPPPAPVQAEPVAELDLFMEDEETTQLTPAPQDALSWLESLAVGNSGVESTDSPMGGLDLSDLGAALTPNATPEDPMAWLESLSGAQEATIPGLEDFSLDLPAQPIPPSAPSAPAGDDSLEWLESLAKRVGADEEEFITPASMDVPETPASAQNAPGYTDFTFESAPPQTPGNSQAFELSGLGDFGTLDDDTPYDTDEMDDSNDWLSALAAGQDVAAPPFATEQSDEPQNEDILSALQKGENISPDTLADWMGNLLDEGARRTDIADYIDENDAQDEVLQAEIPDWLVQQVGAPPPIDEAPPAPKPVTAPLVKNIVQPPDVNMPDWLTDDVATEEASAKFDFESIFADEEEAELTPIMPARSGDLDVDTSDPWVEAFEEELKQGDEIPAWYLKKLSETDSEPFTPVEHAEPLAPVAQVNTGAPLQTAHFPAENELPHGDLQAVPDWLDANLSFTPAQPAVTSSSPAPVMLSEASAALDDDMPDWLKEQVLDETSDGDDTLPDWLKEAGVSEELVSDVPDWLRETLPTDEVEQVTHQPTPPAPAPAPAPAPVTATSAPVPVPAPVAAAVNVEAALSEARANLQKGDLDASLQSYESVVRANQRVEVVVQDLSRLVNDEKHKQNPAIYRVLGDSLMRQGNLQQALDTYRKALNLL